MINIILAHESKLICDGLAMLLDAESDMCVVARGRTGREALDLCVRHNPHILLVSPSFPDMDAMSFLGHRRQAGIKVRVAVMGLNGTGEYGARLLLNGACSISSKDMPGDELPQLIRNSMSQEFYVSGEIKEDILAAMVAASRKSRTSLTPRERQVVSAYASGHKRARIAADLEIDPRTVETHRRRAMKKLCVTSNAELYKTVQRMGIVEP